MGAKRGFKSPIERAQEQLDEMTGVNTPPVDQADPGATPPADQASAVPAGQQEAASQPPVTTPPTDDPNGESYKSRWETLQGMYRSSQEQVQILQGRIMGLEAQVKTLTEQLAADQQPASAPAGFDELVNQLTDQIGADAAAPIKEMILAAFNPMKAQVESVASDNMKTRQERFEDALTGQVPEWRTYLADTKFSQWLQANSEPVSGISYAECFDRANEKWNLTGLVNIFNRYKEAVGATPPPPPNNNNENQQPAADPREALIAPGRSGGGRTPDQQPQERVWRQSEVNQFYKDVALGKYRGRENDITKTEAEIFRANQAGRIVAG